MGTSGAQLAAWCLKNNVVGFKNVYCSDNLPKVYQPQNMCCIVNHSPCDSQSGGTHWMAFRIQGAKAFWFDSYGMPPDNTEENILMYAPGDKPTNFLRYFKQSGVENYVYNSFDLQSVGSEVCGLYACYFCKHGLPDLNPNAWSFFTKNVVHNDGVIKKLVRVYFY